MAIDVAATAIPFIPGGVATAIKAGRAVNATADLVGVVNKVDNVVDAAKTAERVDDAVDLGKQLDNVPCPFNSFSAETPVLTEDGPRPISELVEGDLVYAWNEVTQQIKLQPILDTISHHDPSIVLLALAGETLETTDEHPFYVVEESEWSSYLSIGKWVEAGDLQPGDAILQADGETGEVLSVQVVAAPQWMYNLTVDIAHTFFVGDGQWLVHNIGCFRNASGSADSLTPRPGKDDVPGGGISFWDSLDKLKPGKYVKVASEKLHNLSAVLDNPQTGHISISPSSWDELVEWAASRGGDTVHTLTEELMNAVIEQGVK